MAEIKKVAFLGTGIMGYPMARRLCEAGYPLCAWNRSPAKAQRLAVNGAKIAASPAQAVADADVVLVMLSDGPTCDDVLLKATHSGGGAVVDSMRPGAILIVMSSIPMETAQGQAQVCAEHGLGYLDAPVSGGDKGADQGTLAIMVGGEAQKFEQCATLLRGLGRPVLVGPAGCGQLAKLANQMIVANTINTVAEALLLASKGGADPAAVRTALQGGFADSAILNQHGERICNNAWQPGGAAKYQLKDCRTAMALAAKLNLDLPLSKSATQMYEAMVTHGDGDLDHSAVYLELRRLNNLG